MVSGPMVGWPVGRLVDSWVGSWTAGGPAGAAGVLTGRLAGGTAAMDAAILLDEVDDAGHLVGYIVGPRQQLLRGGRYTSATKAYLALDFLIVAFCVTVMVLSTQQSVQHILEGHATASAAGNASTTA